MHVCILRSDHCNASSISVWCNSQQITGRIGQTAFCTASKRPWKLNPACQNLAMDQFTKSVTPSHSLKSEDEARWELEAQSLLTLPSATPSCTGLSIPSQDVFWHTTGLQHSPHDITEQEARRGLTQVLSSSRGATQHLTGKSSVLLNHYWTELPKTPQKESREPALPQTSHVSNQITSGIHQLTRTRATYPEWPTLTSFSSV